MQEMERREEGGSEGNRGRTLWEGGGGGGFCQVTMLWLTFWALIDLFPALHYDAVALLIARA